MSNTFSPSRYVLQSDWDISIANKTDSFWTGLKEPGKDGIYCNFFPTLRDGGDAVDLQPSDPNFAANYDYKQRSLHIYDPSRHHGTTFFAPSSTGGNIHKKNIYFIDVTAGGLGVSSDSVGNLTVWETQSFSTRRSLAGHFGDVYSCKFFPSGLVILSGGADMLLKIWSVETGECARTLMGHRQAVTDLGFVDRGRNVLSCSKDGTCRLWDCGSGACLAKITPDGGQLNALSVAAGSTVASSTSGENEVGTENKLLAVACENGAIGGYSLGDKSKIFEMRCDSTVNACTYLDQNTLICGSEKGFIFALDVRKASSFLHVIKDDRGAVWSLCGIGKGYWASFGDGSVCYRTLDPTKNGSFSGKELSGSDCDPVYRVCSDGRNLYTCCRDAKIRKYSVE